MPPAKQLFAFDASASPPRPAATASCGAAQAELSRSAHARRQAALARIAALVAAGPGGDAQALDGRGYAYPVQRDPSLEILRIQREAQRLQAGGAR